MPTKTTPKDFFVHVAATIALYVAAGAIINLVVSVIDYSFPDKLAGYFAVSSVAWPISMLVVLIPLLYVLEWILKKDILRMPEKRDLWVRRWRIYLTLFLTGATIVGDLIVLINTYINGEVTERFIFKVLAILIICGVIFTYYLLDRATESHKVIVWRKMFAWIGLVLIVVSIVSGFIIVGSPAKQRALRFDSQRVSDLSGIQYQIVNYWQNKGVLPSTLTDLKDSISGYAVPVDPDNQTAYEYSITTPSARTLSTDTDIAISSSNIPSFELCATFDLPSQDLKGRGTSYPSFTISSYSPYYGSDSPEIWKHDAGRACFSRNIDKEKYPTTNKPAPMMQGV